MCYIYLLVPTGPHGHRLTAEVLTANYLELFMKAVHELDAALPGVTLQQLQVLPSHRRSAVEKYQMNCRCQHCSSVLAVLQYLCSLHVARSVYSVYSI
jgi:hypothetical protein